MSLLLASTSHYVGIAIDIAIVIILLTFAFIGYHHGLLKSLLALCSTAVVLFVAIYFANDFAKIINKIYDFTLLIADKLAPSIENMDPVYATTFPIGLSGSQFYGAFIAQSNTNIVIKKFFQYALKGYSSESLEGLKVSEVLAGSVASIIMTVITGILLFIILKIALGLLGRFFDNITRSKVIGGINKIFGFVFGAIKGSALILFFVVITIILSFVPKINKKIYPLIQNDTFILKVAYNTSEDLIEKHLIKSDLISKWINNLWDNRNLNKAEPETIDKKASLLDNSNFTTSNNTSYTSVEEIVIGTDGKYYRLNKLETLSTNETINISITLTYTSDNTIDFKLYSIDNLNNEIIKSDTSTTIKFDYVNINYTDYILELTTNETDITAQMEITIN